MSHAKPHDERAGHRTSPEVLGGSSALVAPPLPRQLRNLPEDLVERWALLWTSPVAVVLDPVTDLEPMTRLFRLYALGRKMQGAVEQQIEWLEGGDVGSVFDPQFSRITLGFAAEIRQLEQTLGITPRGRLVIGAAVARASGAGGQQGQVPHDDADD